MRGLDEIRKVNENPHGFHGEEHFGTKHVGDVPYTYGAEVADKIKDLKTSARPAGGKLAALEALAGLMVLDVLTAEHQYHPSHMDRIQPGIDQPPFVEFWANLNAHREAAGQPEALYREAKTSFAGGETPIGAMTFIGKQWDGLRAVPAEPVKYLGGTRPAYHGEYREITVRGTRWHKVVNSDNLPIVYKLPEAALTAAEYQRNASVSKRFR